MKLDEIFISRKFKDKITQDTEREKIKIKRAYEIYEIKAQIDIIFLKKTYTLYNKFLKVMTEIREYVP